MYLRALNPANNILNFNHIFSLALVSALALLCQACLRLTVNQLKAVTV